MSYGSTGHQDPLWYTIQVLDSIETVLWKFKLKRVVQNEGSVDFRFSDFVIQVNLDQVKDSLKRFRGLQAAKIRFDTSHRL